MSTLGVNDDCLVAPPDVVRARKELEDEIEEHAKAIIMLKSRLNTMTRIAQLPSEIVSEIFVCLAQDYFYDDHASYHTYPRVVPDWVRVAHVCHAWREIALSTPRLWSFISVTKRSVAEQLLVRSKKAPLAIAIGYLAYNDARGKLLEEILPVETFRLRELRINGPAANVYTLCAKLTEPANILHTLVLSDKDRYTGSTAGSSISHNLFGGQFPRLRSLEIRGLAITWDNPVFRSTLTHLVVSAAPQNMGSFEQFVSVVEQMTGLQRLHLTNAIPPIPASSRPPSRVVAFPHLRDMNLDGPTMNCANFFGLLCPEVDIRPNLTCHGETGSQDLVTSLKAHLARSKPLHTLQLTRHPGQGYGPQLVLLGWRTEVVFSQDVVMEPAAFTITIVGPPFPNLARQFIRDSAMFKNIQSLAVDTTYPQDCEWKEIFLGVPNLREITIRHLAQEGMLTALSKTRRGKRHRPPTVALPRLKVLKFWETRLASPEYDEEDEFFDRLIDCMILRCNYNYPVQEVHLTECVNILRDDVDRLREVVPEVVWDGLEDIEEDEDEDEDDEDDEDEDEDAEVFFDSDYGDPYYDDVYGVEYDDIW